MEENQSLVHAPGSSRLKEQFATFIDAMRFAQRAGDLRKRISDIEGERDTRLRSLDEVVQNVTDLVRNSAGKLGEEISKQLADQLSSFSMVAVDQAKKQVEKEYSERLKESTLAFDSDREKELKSL